MTNNAFNNNNINNPQQSHHSIPSIHRYYILRHGETDANAAGIIQGSSDVSRLTPRGKDQALSVASFLRRRRQQDPIDSIIVSPLARARETLSMIRTAWSSSSSLSSEVVLPDEMIMTNLREIDLYDWEMQTKESLKRQYPSSYDAWKRGDPSNFIVYDSPTNTNRYPLIELWDRATLVWDNVNLRQDRTTSSTKSTLLVCHGSLGQALLGSALGYDATFFRRAEFPNGGLVEMEWKVGEEMATRWRWCFPDEQRDWNYR